MFIPTSWYELVIISAQYVAGFIDGEGCIDCQRMYPSTHRSNFYVRPRVRISQTASSSFILEILKSKYGGHETSLRRHNSNSHKGKPSVSWELLSKGAIKELLKEIEPYLIIKKEQAKLCLWWFDNMSGRHPKNGYQQALSKARMKFAEELKLMKVDPQRLSEEAVQRINSALMR